MSHAPLPEVPSRVPDFESERRIAEIRRQAMQKGVITGKDFAPAGAPLLKELKWKTEVPLYLFVGGAAGASAVIACAADLLSSTNNDGLISQARWVAAGGGVLSSALLTLDLGVPSRFINMLRVFKPQSPMSMGAWTLTAFSTFSAAAAFANRMRQELDGTPVYVVERLTEMLAAATGVIMAGYTGVLIGGTTIPVWNSNIGTLPAHFTASGMNSAVSILELMGNQKSRALNLLGIAASAYESFEGLKLESERTRVNEPLRKGLSGIIVRLGGILSGPVPLLLRLAYSIGGKQNLRRAAAWSGIAGSLLTRFGWIRAGHASAKDYKLPLELE